MDNHGYHHIFIESHFTRPLVPYNCQIRHLSTQDAFKVRQFLSPDNLHSAEPETLIVQLGKIGFKVVACVKTNNSLLWTLAKKTP